MTWKTVVVWDLSDQKAVDRLNRFSELILDTYSNEFSSRVVEPELVKTPLIELNQMQTERFWATEADAQWYLDTIIAYMIVQGMEPVSQSAEPVTE